MAREQSKTEQPKAAVGQTPATPESGRFSVTVMSFGYKSGPPPTANMVFDVRFLKNPFWVPELRPLTGRDQAVAEYVLSQKAAGEFLDSLMALLETVLPRFQELGIEEFSLALGCTGGQHRSTALVEAIARRMSETHPQLSVKRVHRELDEVFS